MKKYTYDEWRATAVRVSDLKPFNSITGLYIDTEEEEATPGYIFIDSQPVLFSMGVIEEHRTTTGIDYLVRIGNDEQRFISLHLACKHLWSASSRAEFGHAEPKWLLVFVRGQGETDIQRFNAIDAVDAYIDNISLLPKHNMEAKAALRNVGNRYYELPYGHLALFPYYD